MRVEAGSGESSKGEKKIPVKKDVESDPAPSISGR